MAKILRIATVICLVAGFLISDNALSAQSSAAEMLEQARERAREIEELKAALNGPDQNMRLAVFNIMVNSDDEATREVALEAGLASTDSLLQAMAFKAVIMNLDRLVLTVEIDKSQPKAGLDFAKEWLDTNGNTYTIDMPKKDPATGTFWISSGSKGEVSGTIITFQYGYNTGTLQLIDEVTVAGKVRFHRRGYSAFQATARIR